MDNIELQNEACQSLKDFREENYKKFNSIEWFTPKEDWRRFNITNFSLKTPEIKIEKKKKAIIENIKFNENDKFLAEIKFLGSFLKSIKKDNCIADKLKIIPILDLLNSEDEDTEELRDIFYSKIEKMQDKQKLCLWNLTYFNLGLFIDLAWDCDFEKPIQIEFESRKDDEHLFPLLFINARKNSKLSIVKKINCSHMLVLNELTILDQKENSSLNFYNIYTDLDKTTLFSSLNYEIGDQAKTYQFDYINKLFLSKIENKINLVGDGANYKQESVVILKDKNHINIKTHQYHKGENSKSLVAYRSASLDYSYFVHNGLIEVENEASNNNSYFSSKNLTLSNTAKVSLIPKLKIKTSKVACSHGCTVSNVKPMELYYLKSKGIEEHEAKQIIIEGFFEELIKDNRQFIE